MRLDRARNVSGPTRTTRAGIEATDGFGEVAEEPGRSGLEGLVGIELGDELVVVGVEPLRHLERRPILTVERTTPSHHEVAGQTVVAAVGIERRAAEASGDRATASATSSIWS